MSQTTNNCKNCRNVFEGKYCNRCGQKVFTEHDKSILHLFEEGFHFVTHFEGKFFITGKTMFTNPGKFSLDYCNGIQQKYFRPLSFFLLIVVIYLLFPLFEGLNMPLKFHFSSWYGEFAQALVQRLMAQHHLSETYVAEHFHNISEKVSKLLLFLVIPVMAAWSKVLTIERKDKLFFDHFIFSTEINALLILGCFLILPSFVFLYLAFKELLVQQTNFNEMAVAYIIIGILLIYTFFAAKKFFGFKWLKAFVFTVFYIAFYVLILQYVYKFILFWITISLVH